MFWTNFSSSVKLLTQLCTASAFFLAMLTELYLHPSMIRQQLPRAGSTVRLVVSRFRTSFLDWNSTFVSNLIPELSLFVNFNFKYWFCDLDTFPLFASHLVPCDQWRPNQACLGHVSSVDLNKTIKDGGITVGFWIIKVMTPIWNYLLSFVHLGIINTFESS